jgi:hypothetical protein
MTDRDFFRFSENQPILPKKGRISRRLFDKDKGVGYGVLGDGFKKKIAKLLV